MGRAAARLLAPLLLLGCASPPPPSAGVRPGERLPCSVLYAETAVRLTVSCGGRIEPVALIGVGAPAPRRDGERAANFARSLAPEGTPVVLELGRVPRDREGRLRSYVHLPAGAMLNARLLEEGYAVPAEDGEQRHAGLFAALYSEARRYRKGLWSGR